MLNKNWMLANILRHKRIWAMGLVFFVLSEAFLTGKVEVQFLYFMGIVFGIFCSVSFVLVSAILWLLGDKKYFLNGAWYAFLIFLFFLGLMGVRAWTGSHLVSETFFLLGALVMVAPFVLLPILVVGKVIKLKGVVILLIFELAMLGYMGWGIYNAHTLRIKDISFVSDKLQKNYKIALVSDLHIGSEKPKYLKKVVDRLLEIKPDMIFLTGDLVDEASIKPEDFSVFKKINIPQYFVYGNHEFYAGKEDDFFADTNFMILDNEEFSKDDLQIIGLNEYKNSRGWGSGNVGEMMKSIKIDDSKYVILLNHDPSLAKSFSDYYDVNLMLSGHLHRGQFFPFNLVVKMIYGQLAYGQSNLGGMDIYVTSGTGVWGPNLRVGTNNEITVINLLKE